MNKDLVAIFEYLERERGIKREVIIDAIQESLQIAARKSIHGAVNVQVQIHSKTGEIEVFCDKEVVEKVTNPSEEISLKAALELKPDAQMNDMITVAITPKDFGRIAAQKARQIISQKLKGAERDVIYEEYRHRVNQLISGTVKRVIRGSIVIVDLGKVEGVLPPRNYPKTEKYQVGDRVFALLLEVRDTEMGGAEVVLSRSHPEFVKQLLIQEVPEISDGLIEIEKIVREAGYRTKIIVRSLDPKIDPVGACIGMRGIRIKNIVRELHNEKIDVIPYAPEKLDLLAAALDPIQIKSVKVSEDGNHIFLVVDDESFPTAIGKKGLNVRLLAALIDAQLEIRKESEHQKLQAIERANLATSEDVSLDEPLAHIEGVSALLLDQLIAAGFDTPRKLLLTTPDALISIPGINIKTAEKLLDQVRFGNVNKGNLKGT